MNWFKNTRPPGEKLDNRGYFAVGQMTAFAVVVIAMAIILFVPGAARHPVMAQFRSAVLAPHPDWVMGSIIGTSFGVVAIFSVFLFLFQGRTATFAGLVNRLTSLIAGTVSTLLFALLWRGSQPKPEDWVALAFIFIAVGFLARAERKRLR
jgi:drug/metabolite transporter (DMT)-like permease